MSRYLHHPLYIPMIIMMFPLRSQSPPVPIKPYLIGGFKHFLFSIIYGTILPIDFHIFSRWLKPFYPLDFRSPGAGADAAARRALAAAHGGTHQSGHPTPGDDGHWGTGLEGIGDETGGDEDIYVIYYIYR